MSGLFGSTTVEVAIGLFFVYWLLSIVCSAVQETISAWFKWRAKDLENGLLNLLTDDAICEQVLNHPLIMAMGNSGTETRIVRGLAGESPQIKLFFLAGARLMQRVSYGASWILHHGYANKPSYIPSRTFSTALFDCLAPSTEQPLTAERLRARAEQLARLQAPSDVTDRDLQDVLIGLHLRLQQDLPGDLQALKQAVPKAVIDSMLARLDQIQNADLTFLRDQIKSHLDATRNLLTTARPSKMFPIGPLDPIQQERDRLTAELDTAQTHDAAQQSLDLLKQHEATFRVAVSLPPLTTVCARIRATPAQLPAIVLARIRATLAKSPGGDRASELIDQRITSILAAKQSIGRSVLATIEESRDPSLLYEGIQQLKARAENLPDSSAGEAHRKALVNALSPARTIGELRQILAQIPDKNALKPKLTEMVDALAAQADSIQIKLDTVRKNLENWFDHSMDRVTGIYKRRAHTWLLCISLAITLVLGADTIRIGQFLAENATVRAALVNEASAAVRAASTPSIPPAGALSPTPGTRTPTLTRTPTVTPTPTGETSTSTTVTGSGAGPAPTSTPTPPVSPSTQQLLTDVRSINGLLGYDDVWPKLHDENQNFAWQKLFQMAIVSKVAGLLLTAFAVSLGAPFWFDLLQRLVNVRTTGPKPEERDAKHAKQASSGSG